MRALYYLLLWGTFLIVLTLQKICELRLLCSIRVHTNSSLCLCLIAGIQVLGSRRPNPSDTGPHLIILFITLPCNLGYTSTCLILIFMKHLFFKCGFQKIKPLELGCSNRSLG